MKTLVAFDLDDTLIPEVLFLRSGAHHIAGWLSERYGYFNPHRIISCMEVAIFSRCNHYSALEKYISKIQVEYPQASSIINNQEISFVNKKEFSAIISNQEAIFIKNDTEASIDMKEVVAEFRRHKPDPEIYHLAPSIKIALERLQKQEIPLALITDGRSETQRNKIASAGLSRYFNDSEIFISEETGHDKTVPDNFIALMRRHPEIERFVYVADNPAKDFRHPLALGWEIHQAPPFPLMIHPSFKSPLPRRLV